MLHRVGKIAQLNAIVAAVPGNFAHPTDRIRITRAVLRLASLEIAVAPVVIERAHHMSDLLAEFPRRGRHTMGIEGRLILP